MSTKPHRKFFNSIILAILICLPQAGSDVPAKPEKNTDNVVKINELLLYATGMDRKQTGNSSKLDPIDLLIK